MKIIKSKYIFLIFVFAALFSFVQCEEEDEVRPAIFPDVQQMDASYNGSTFSFTNVPPEVEHLVLGIFDAPIIPSGKTIKNLNDLKGGCRTGLENGYMNRETVSTLFEYDQSLNNGNGDFNENSPYSLPSDFHWAVWGYNSDWNLIAATSEKP